MAVREKVAARENGDVDVGDREVRACLHHRHRVHVGEPSPQPVGRGERVRGNLFIDDYYVANLDIPQEILDFVRTHKADTFWNKSNYMIRHPYYISFHKEFESQGDTMATFLLFQKLDSVKSSQIDSFKNLSQLIIVAIFSISIIVILFFYFYLKI